MQQPDVLRGGPVGERGPEVVLTQLPVPLEGRGVQPAIGAAAHAAAPPPTPHKNFIKVYVFTTVWLLAPFGPQDPPPEPPGPPKPDFL